jgi:hypothetical protein
MLFGYLNEPEPVSKSDVFCRDTPVECFSFERPLVLATELHVAGAMAFANSHGFGGISLVEWAISQSLHSAAQRLEAEGHAPPSSRR